MATTSPATTTQSAAPHHSNLWEAFEPLSPAEELLIEATKNGTPCDLLTAYPNETDRIIRSALLRALCLQPDAVDPNGINVTGAIFADKITMPNVDLSFGLTFRQCEFRNGIVLTGASLRYLHIFGGRIDSEFQGDHLHSAQGVSLSANGKSLLKITSTVYLVNAHIKGIFNCDRTEFVQIDLSLRAQGIEVGQSLFLREATFAGSVRVNSAKIHDQFECDRTQFNNSGDMCFYAQGIEVGQSLFLREATFAGSVRVNSAKIHNQFECDRTQFNNSGDMCFYAQGIEVGQSLFLREATFAGSVRVSNAKIHGQFDCDKATFKSSGKMCFHAQGMEAIALLLRDTTFAGSVNVNNAKIQGPFECDKAQFNGNGDGCFIGFGLDVYRNLFMRDAIFAGSVDVNGTKIYGQFDCTKAVFNNSGEKCFVAQGMVVGQSLYLRGATFAGSVRVNRTNIHGQFECDHAAFNDPGEKCFFAQGMEVEQSLRLSNATFAGSVDVNGAKILGLFNCDRAVFNGSGKMCFFAQGLETKALLLTNATFAGSVNVNNAKIQGPFECDKAQFNGNGEGCFIGFGLDVHQNLFMRDATFAGSVDVNGTKIYGQFDCTKAMFNNSGEKCFVAQGMVVGQSLYLRGATFAGSVRVNSTKIHGQFECDHAAFNDLGEKCFFAQGMEVEQSLRLSDATFAGSVDINSTKIQGSIFTEEASFSKSTFRLQQADVAGDFVWAPKEFEGQLDLTNAHVEVWHDSYITQDKKRCAQYFLEGFTYDRFRKDMNIDIGALVMLLDETEDKKYHPQPYQQMAKVLRETGHESEARTIAIHRRRAQRRGLNGFKKFFDGLLDLTINYGYRPWWALFWMFWCVVPSSVYFNYAYQQGIMVPESTDVLPIAVDNRNSRLVSLWLADEQKQQPGKSAEDWAKRREAMALAVREDAAKRQKQLNHYLPKEKQALSQFVPDGYPQFNSLVYALDEFLPIVELHQADHWIPDRAFDRGWWSGKVSWWILWGLTFAGWILSTLFVSAFTGLIKTE